MTDLRELRSEPSGTVLDAARQWLGPVRAALNQEFLAGYLHGSALTLGFDSKRSRINVLVIVRALPESTWPALEKALAARKGVSFDSLFLTRGQLQHSLDVFPIEFLEIKERRLLLEGEDVIAPLQVPSTYLRLQCEHELRGKHLRLRQYLLHNLSKPAALEQQLAASASSFATLFRTLLRLKGEQPSAEPAQVIERIAERYHLDVQGLLGAHLTRTAGIANKSDAARTFGRFVTEIDRLIQAIDELRVP